MRNGYPKEGQIAAAKALIAQADAIHSELFDAANELKDECHELIRDSQVRRYKKPPCTLSVRSLSGQIGPKIVWVSYSKNKITRKSGAPTRFTREITGRRNGRYSKTIFSGYEEEIRPRLWEIEDRAAALRQRVSFWRATIKEAHKIMEQGGE